MLLAELKVDIPRAAIAVVDFSKCWRISLGPFANSTNSKRRTMHNGKVSARLTLGRRCVVFRLLLFCQEGGMRSFSCGEGNDVIDK